MSDLERTTSGNRTSTRAQTHDSNLQELVAEAAREYQRNTYSAQLLVIHQCQRLWDALHLCSWFPAAATPDEEAAGPRINYEGFCKAAALCREEIGYAAHPYFSASNFLRFEPDNHGMISVANFFTYVMDRNSFLQLRAQLNEVDSDGNGLLTSAQLEDFVELLLPELPGATNGAAHDAVDLPTYCRVVAIKLMFFCGCNDRVKVKDVLISGWLAELLELRHPAEDELRRLNTFTMANVGHLVNLFKGVADDGRISVDGVSRFCGGMMSPLFVERLFQEHSSVCGLIQYTGVRPSKPNTMDFSAFLHFVFAWENSLEPAALRYFFSVFDLGAKGYISQADLYMFVKDMISIPMAREQVSQIRIEDIIGEVTLMVNPVNPQRITLQDILASKMGNTFVGILANVRAFLVYENRENLAAS